MKEEEEMEEDEEDKTNKKEDEEQDGVHNKERPPEESLCNGVRRPITNQSHLADRRLANKASNWCRQTVNGRTYSQQTAVNDIG